MTTEAMLPKLPIAEVIARCADETALYREGRDHDPRFCFELFRRAFIDGSQRAWDALYSRYASQVRSWVRRRDATIHSDEDVEDIVSGTFARFWAAIERHGFKFESLARLLSYLSLCVGAAIVDNNRRRNRDALAHADEMDVRVQAPDDPVASAHRKSVAANCWNEILKRAKTEEERVYVEIGLRQGLKPKQIAARCPEVFADPGAVNRTRANFIARLRRDVDLRTACADLLDAASE